MNSKALVVLAASLFLAGGSAFAGSLADKANQEAVNKKLKAGIEQVTKACGVTITADLKVSSFANQGEKNYAAVSANYCVNVIEGIAGVCRGGADAKTAVSGKIKQVVCSWNAAIGPYDFAKAGLKLNGSALDAQYSWKTGNMGSETQKYLKDNL